MPSPITHTLTTGDKIKVDSDGNTTITLSGGTTLTSTDSTIAEDAKRAQDKAGTTGWEVTVTSSGGTISKISIEKTV